MNGQDGKSLVCDQLFSHHVRQYGWNMCQVHFGTEQMKLLFIRIADGILELLAVPNYSCGAQ